VANSWLDWGITDVLCRSRDTSVSTAVMPEGAEHQKKKGPKKPQRRVHRGDAGQ
jgi:hypothetical protein